MVLWCVSALEIRAQVQRVSLSEALDLFAQHNMELRAARTRADEMAGLARQAAAYPNPSASITHEPIWRGDESLSESYVNLSQRIEWPALRRARIEAAKGMTAVARADLQNDSLRLALEVVRTFVEAAGATERRDILSEAVDLFRRADSASVRLATEGEASGYRLRRIRVERARYEDRLAEAVLDRRDALRDLALLILPEIEAARLDVEMDLPAVPSRVALDDALDRARSNRADLARARASAEAARARTQEARRQRVPSPTLTAGYKRQSNGFKGVFVGTAIPLPLFDRNSGTIAARGAALSTAEHRRALTEASVERDVRRAYDRYASLAERSERIGEGLLGDADGLLHAAQVGYAEGEMSLVELLDAAEAYSDARLSRLEMRMHLHNAFYELLRAAGGRIETYGFPTLQ
ncbi:MAG: TolC family protein [Rhodothermales bacterium]